MPSLKLISLPRNHHLDQGQVRTGGRALVREGVARGITRFGSSVDLLAKNRILRILKCDLPSEATWMLFGLSSLQEAGAHLNPRSAPVAMMVLLSAG
jgi:hypothetical protein